MVATGVQHAPAAAGATVRYRSLQWSRNQRPSQLTIQMKTSAAHQHLPPPVQPQPSQQLGLFRQCHAMGAQLGLHGAAHWARNTAQEAPSPVANGVRVGEVCFEPLTRTRETTCLLLHRSGCGTGEVLLRSTPLLIEAHQLAPATSPPPGRCPTVDASLGHCPGTLGAGSPAGARRWVRASVARPRHRHTPGD
jgi:hypothetical protein